MPGKLCFQSCRAVPGPRSYLTIRPGPEMMEKYVTDTGLAPVLTLRCVWWHDDYLDRRKEPSSSALSSAITPSQEASKETQPCPDENRMTMTRSDSCDHWRMTESLLTLSSAIKSVHHDHYHIPWYSNISKQSFKHPIVWFLIESHLTPRSQ